MSEPSTIGAAGRGPTPRLIIERLNRHLDPECANALLRKAGQGDEGAFGVLFDWTAPVILGCLRRALSGPGDAEHVTERVYVRLWGDAPAFDAEVRSAHAVLLALTRSELVRWHHRQRRSQARRLVLAGDPRGRSDAMTTGSAASRRGPTQRERPLHSLGQAP